MKVVLWLSLLGLATAARAEDIEPAVQTTTVATPAPVPPPVAPAVRQGATDKAKAQDQIELDATQITGNRELPNVMYVVPWKKPDLGDFAGRPPKSLLDELLAPVDRDVFRRQNRYFSALQPDTAPVGVTPGSSSATGAAPELPAPPARDEK